MAAARIRTDEIFGLSLAVLAHAALLGVLLLRPPSADLIPPPERITVTLSEDVGLTSTAPEPAAKPAPDAAPVRGEPLAAKVELKPAPLPSPPPVIKPKPLPRIQPSPPPVLRPVARPVAKPLPRAIPVPRPIVRPSPAPVKTAAKTPPAPRTPSTTPARAPAGGSRFADAFKQGLPGSQTNGPARTPPAAAIGPAVQSALAGAISRQLKPRWAAPQGVDTERLVTVLSWSLNRDGALSGTPIVVRQEGINDANRPQAARHAEQAIRAVQLAAPFNLPPEYYDAWKRVASFRFDRRLSQ